MDVTAQAMTMRLMQPNWESDSVGSLQWDEMRILVGFLCVWGFGMLILDLCGAVGSGVIGCEWILVKGGRNLGSVLRIKGGRLKSCIKS